MQPWFKLYAADFLLDDDLFNLDPAAESLLVRMWAICWRDGYVPSDPEELSLKVRRKQMHVQMHLQSVLRFFTEVAPGRLVSERMEAERAQSKKTSEERSNAAKSKWNKAKQKVASVGVAALASAKQMLSESDSDSEISTGAKAPVSASSTPIPRRHPIKGPNVHMPEELQVEFWRAVKLVPPDKFVNPSAASKSWAAAVASGDITGPELAGCLRRYIATFALDRRCYITQLHAWLENRGYLAFLEEERRGDPDPTPTGAPYRGPMHKRPLTSEERAHLEEMP